MFLHNASAIAGDLYAGGDVELYDASVIYGSVYSYDDLEVHGGSAVHHDQQNRFAYIGRVRDEIGNHALAIGTSPNQPGRYGKSFGLNGTNYSILIPHRATYELPAGTVSLWFNADDLAGVQGLFTKDSTSFDNGGHLRIVLDGSAVQVRLQDANRSYQITGGAVSVGAWHHVAVGFGEGGLRLYVDGSLVASDSYAGGIDTNPEPIALGADTWHSGGQTVEPLESHFDGRLDDVRIYNQNFNDTQALALYDTGDPRAAGVRDHPRPLRLRQPARPHHRRPQPRHLARRRRA